MFDPIEIKPNIYWVGAIDWNKRVFDGHSIERGASYNAYLIIDSKITLIDTCPQEFSNEMLERINKIIDPKQINFLISNHVEMDHSGAIPLITKLAPHITIITSDPQGLRGLTSHFGDTLKFKGVKTGDTLSIGKRTLSFYQTPMVHWPDNMVTYSDFDKLLFSNDAFGQHVASSQLFDDENNLAYVFRQAKKYYANICLPYNKNVQKALKTLKNLVLDYIAPSHGIIWRKNIDKILEKYHQWCSNNMLERAVVVYDSMWNTTETMALEIVETFRELNIPVKLFSLQCSELSDIMTDVLDAKYLAVGSPTLNKTMMPKVAEFLYYMKGLAPKNHIAIPFGSYGWIPLGPDQIAEIFDTCGFKMPAGTICNQWTIDQNALDKINTLLKKSIISTRD